MSLIYLARHGETDWNARGKLQGSTDIPLNEAGRAQAVALGERLRGQPITSVTTSDLARAVETGRIVALALGVTRVHVDADLRERSFGMFEGLTRDECASQHPEAWRAWVERTIAPQGGEPREAAVLRMTRGLGRVRARSESEVSLVISHGASMRLLLMECLGGAVPPIGNAAVYRIESIDDRFAPVLWNG